MSTLTCQEAHVHLSKTTYVPCGNLAVYSVKSERDGRSYNMCEMCEDHATKNRGQVREGPATPDNPPVVVDQTAPLAQESEDPVFDYSGFGDETPSADGDLAALSNLAEQQRHHEDEVERLMHELKKAQNLLKDVAEGKIPELMDKVGMSKFSTRNGLNIAIKESIRASMGAGPAKERNLDWLEQNGHEVVIKMSVEVPFGKGEEDRATAKALAEQLRKDGHPASFARKVEPSTLSSLARELLEEGRAFPEEQFNVFRQRTSKIS